MNNSTLKAMEYARDGMFVPTALINEMVDTADIKEDSKVAVLFSFEMLPVLQQRGQKDVVLIMDSPKKYVRNICAKYGYEVKTFDESEDMKFDVVLTNPPYQSANEGERNIGAPAWPVFIEKTMSMMTDGGTAMFVTPATWMNRAKRGAWKPISQYDLAFVNPNVKEHFPNIGGNGGTFCFFQLNKQDYTGTTMLSTGKSINFHSDPLPRNNKYMDSTGFDLVDDYLPRVAETEVFCGPINPSINSDHWSDKKTTTHLYETYYSGAPERRSLWCDKPIGDHGKWKLVVANCGNFYNSLELTQKGVGRQGNYILGTKKELTRLRGLLLSDESRKLCEVMIEGNYNNALKYIVESNVG